MKAIVALLVLALAIAPSSAVRIRYITGKLCEPLSSQLEGTFYSRLLRAAKDHDIGDFNNKENYDIYFFVVDQVLASWVAEMGYRNGSTVEHWSGANEVLQAIKYPEHPKHYQAKALGRYFASYHMAHAPRKPGNNLGVTAGGADVFFGNPTTGPTLYDIVKGPVEEPFVTVDGAEFELVARNRCYESSEPVEKLLKTRQLVLTVTEVIAPVTVLPELD